MALHNELGKWGEEIARDYYIRLGYAIVEQNARIGHTEIDMIVMKDNRIAFVEVKTRSSLPREAFEAIDTRKIKRMARAADSYLRVHGILFEPQFDIIIVAGSPNEGHTVAHFPDAFRAPLTSL